MLKLPMTSTCSDVPPPILLETPNNFADLHVKTSPFAPYNEPVEKVPGE